MSRKRVKCDFQEDLKAVKRERVICEPYFPSIDADPKVLRSRYIAIRNRINNDVRDNLSCESFDKFNSIFREVENLQLLVQKPREQVVDAEAFLDIANSLAASVKAHILGDGLTPSDFVACLLRQFGQHKNNNNEISTDSIVWNNIGFVASPIFRIFHGCSTMLGPMGTELKIRVKSEIPLTKIPPMDTTAFRSHNPRTLAKSEQPQQVGGEPKNERTDTDKNMATMFNILKNKKNVKLECLLLNRKSFAQTVENLFVLSFLVKDGRVEISLDENGCHIVSPCNAPSAASVLSGKASFSHFAFRFDFSDWKLMMNLVPVGWEIMPHRSESNNVTKDKPEIDPQDPQLMDLVRVGWEIKPHCSKSNNIAEDVPETNPRAPLNLQSSIIQNHAQPKKYVGLTPKLHSDQKLECYS